jgi:hypothetical protein
MLHISTACSPESVQVDDISMGMDIDSSGGHLGLQGGITVTVMKLHHSMLLGSWLSLYSGCTCDLHRSVRAVRNCHTPCRSEQHLQSVQVCNVLY